MKYITTDEYNKLVQSFRLGCTDFQAAYATGVKFKTLKLFREHYPKHSEYFDMCRQECVILARQNIAKALQAGDLKTSKWYLERKVPEEFGVQYNAEVPTDGVTLIDDIR